MKNMDFSEGDFALILLAEKQAAISKKNWRTNKRTSKFPHTLKSSHTVAYNPNARRAYEKSQHAEDFGRIKINLFP